MSAKQTLQERYIAALIKRGEREVKRTSRYVVFTSGMHQFFYIGKSGSLRVGATIANSFPVSDKYKTKLLAELEQT